jgi:hypothetical protein
VTELGTDGTAASGAEGSGTSPGIPRRGICEHSGADALPRLTDESCEVH